MYAVLAPYQKSGAKFKPTDVLRLPWDTNYPGQDATPAPALTAEDLKKRAALFAKWDAEMKNGQ
ncbi:hypothetical protein [Lewinella sp. JB7]|uniref:hypothetical protein n=1 Tax=Lewinella sp. JB7 TaxID=2962887 RepID=UPI0020C96895|nr:hypothetical protein [Lewinella sp. JB7]